MTTLPAPIQAIGGSVGALVDILEAGEIDASSVEAAISAIVGVINAIQALSGQASAFPPTVDQAQFAAEFPEQLIDFLVGRLPALQHPFWGQLLRTLGVITLEQVPAGQPPGVSQAAIASADLGGCSTTRRPCTRQLAVGNRDFQAGRVAEQRLRPVRCDRPQRADRTARPAVQNALTGGVAGPDPIHDWVLRVPILGDPRGPIAVEFGFGLYMLPPSGARLPGFAAMPYAEGAAAASIDLSDTLQLTIDAAFDIEGGVGLLVRPNTPPQLLIDIIPGGGGGGRSRARRSPSASCRPPASPGCCSAPPRPAACRSAAPRSRPAPAWPPTTSSTSSASSRCRTGR